MVGIRKYSLGILGRDSEILNISGPPCARSANHSAPRHFPRLLNRPIATALLARCAIDRYKHREFKKKEKENKLHFAFELIPIGQCFV